ncbi:MAG: nucleotidyltransferase domain-containing protein [Acidobacteria bacterium]|nr:nucleotidyltransferase domain-containing protein [Acidobacteriota bacterium]
MLKWPDRAAVDTALQTWSEETGKRRRELERVGYFGSYARGDWGVGSDLDVVIIVSAAPVPFHERPAHWDMLRLPVPVDLLVYTAADWTSVIAQPTHLAKALAKETHWVWWRAQRKRTV